MTFTRRLLGTACGLLLAAPLLAQTHSGIDRSGFDPAVRVQDDLFLAANGGWLSATPIPPDRSRYGITDQLADRASERVRQICEEQGVPPASPHGKVVTYYRAFMDTAAIDRAGLAPLAPQLAEIDALESPAALTALWGRWEGMVASPLAAQVLPDPKEPGIYRVMLWQDGLGLPDRDYYLKPGEAFAKASQAYVAYLEALFAASGDAQAAAHAKTVFALERQLARVQWSRVDSNDALKTYNPRTPAQLAKAAPDLAWQGYFEAARFPAIDRLTVAQPSYVRELGRLLRSTPLASWKLYQRARLLDAQAAVLPQAFRDASFAFHRKALLGEEQPKPRWKQAVSALDGAMGEAVGQIYVARHFPPEYKARMQQLVAHLMTAFGESIDRLGWMSPKTKLKAKEKLARYTVKIGYPDTWRDYSGLQVLEGDALGNDLRAGRFEHERRAARVGQPVDRREWSMTPQTVNAYYDPQLNEIAFPAAILDVPYFDMSADDAANYGSIGSTIGHEISHGFDDYGSQYDGDGKLSNWWTAADRKAFDALGKRLEKQFDRYEPVPGHKVNGKLTLGENIADLSGLEIAYKAYLLSLGGKPAPVIDGMTAEQRFFLSWSISWREKTRDASLIQQLTADPHAPADFRTNGAAINLDVFHDTFGTRPGDRMFKPRAERIHIW